jgi:transcriptional regulator with XRE-family HTH domain
MSQIGQRLQKLRQERGFTQSQLALRADVTLNTIIRTEKGQTDPSMGTLVKFARALEVKPSALIDDDELAPAATA